LVVLISVFVVLALGAYAYHWWVTLPYKIGEAIVSDFNF